MTRLMTLAMGLVLVAGPALASVDPVAPGPLVDFDSGLVGAAMVGAAAFMAWRRRKRG